WMAFYPRIYSSFHLHLFSVASDAHESVSDKRILRVAVSPPPTRYITSKRAYFSAHARISNYPLAKSHKATQPDVYPCAAALVKVPPYVATDQTPVWSTSFDNEI